MTFSGIPLNLLMYYEGPASLYWNYMYPLIVHSLVRLVFETPDLIEESSVAPHVTGRGVLAIVQYLHA